MKQVTTLVIVAILVALVLVFKTKIPEQNSYQVDTGKIEFNSTAEVIGGDNTKAFTYPSGGVGDTTKVKD